METVHIGSSCQEGLVTYMVMAAFAGVMLTAVVDSVFKKLIFRKDSPVSPVVLVIGVLACEGVVLWVTYFQEFSAVTAGKGFIELHFPFPRPALRVPADSIINVEDTLGLQPNRALRTFRHKLDVNTKDGTCYSSGYVCKSPQKGYPSWQSALYSKDLDSLKQAQLLIDLSLLNDAVNGGRLGAQRNVSRIAGNKVMVGVYAGMYWDCLNIAQALATNGNVAGAEELLKRLLAMSLKGLGADHAAVGTTHHVLADFYAGASRYNQAVRSYKQALSIIEKHRGESSLDSWLPLQLGNLGLMSYDEMHDVRAEYALVLHLQQVKGH